MNTVDISMWIKTDSHQCGPAGHEVVVLASIGQFRGIVHAPLGEMPVELLDADFETWCNHEWAKTLITEATSRAKTALRKAIEEVENVT